MAATVDHLRIAHRVIAPTHPGWAGTERAASLNGVGALARAYLDLLAENDARDVVVVGASFGAWVAAQLAAVDLPALVVWGGRDETPLACGRAWADALGRARLVVVPGAGHLPPAGPRRPRSPPSTPSCPRHRWSSPRRRPAPRPTQRSAPPWPGSPGLASRRARRGRCVGMMAGRASSTGSGARPSRSRGRGR